MKLDIQRFANPKLVIDTELNRKNFENGLDKMKSSTQKAGATIKNIVVGLGITKLISTAMNTINQSIDGAISRFDTLNNFSKVMSNLGIASEEADKSIKLMSKRLEGLPTTLDEGARAVQRFTSANGDVEKSTEIFLALNNAILAGGAGAEIQSSALEQLSQAYAKGKMDMMEWRTVQMAFPAQLKQIATAMGVTTEELGEMLREGDNTRESMNKFMETITELNVKGVEGFQNFEEQAKNATGGIGTAITVAKTQVVKGVTDIIDAVNTKLSELNLGSINSVIKKVGDNTKKALDSIAKLITGELSITEFITAGVNSITGYINGFSSKLPDIMKTITSMFKEAVNAIIKNLPTIIQSAKTLISNFITGLQQNLPTIIKAGQDLIFALIDGIVDNLDFVLESAIDIILILAEGFSTALPRLLEKAPELIIKLCDKLTEPEMIVKLMVVGSQIVIALIKGILSSLQQLVLMGPRLIVELVNAIRKRISATDWGQLGRDIVRGIANGITGNISYIKNYIKQFVGNVKKLFQDLFKIGSPSKLMRDEIGIYLAQGIGVGFEDELSSVYKSMQNAIDLEQAKLQANVETGKVFNTLQNSTPIAIDINAPVELDGTKVGRLLTPVVSKTIKTGGGV